MCIHIAESVQRSIHPLFGGVVHATLLQGLPVLHDCACQPRLGVFYLGGFRPFPIPPALCCSALSLFLQLSQLSLSFYERTMKQLTFLDNVKYFTINGFFFLASFPFLSSSCCYNSSTSALLLMNFRNAGEGRPYVQTHTLFYFHTVTSILINYCTSFFNSYC